MTATAEPASVCATLVREHDFPRYAAALFALPDKRRAMLALAAFDFEILRIPDQVRQPLPGEIRLQWWTDLLEGTEHGGAAGHPIAAELLATIKEHALPQEPLQRIIRAHTFDLYDDPMPSRAALEVYLDDTVGEIVAASLRVLGGNVALYEGLIRHAGRALALTRILARLPHDASRRRCFLPGEAMAEHGVSRDEFFAGADIPALRALRDELIATARKHLDIAQAHIKDLTPALRTAFLPLATLQRELDGLQSSPPFALHLPPSRLHVLWSQWRASR